MGDRGREQGTQGAGASLLGSVIAVGGAAAMSGATRTLLDSARRAHGEEQLIGWVLVGLAGAGALLCLYLALIWALAAVILLAGPAGRTGRTLLPALRILAPRLARRVSTGAAVATAATGLVLGPALASEQLPQDAEAPTVFEISQLLPEEDPSPRDAESTGPVEPLPSLGWGGEPAPATETPAVDDEAETATQDDADGTDDADEEPTTAPPRPAEGDGTADEDSAEDTATQAPQDSPGAGSPGDAEASGYAGAPGEGPSEGPAAPAEDATTTEGAPQTGEAPPPADTPTSGAAGGGGDAPAAPRTVVVQQGDTLWSITDDLLGPAPEDPALLASSWPLLHEANQGVIGEDPDLLVPGQVLTVPAALDEEVAS